MDKAQADLDRCIELADRWTACYRERAINNAKMGRYAEALEDNDMILRITPDDYEAHQMRSWILNYLHRTEEALAAIGRAIELAPSIADTYSVRAYILATRGISCTRVEEDIEKALDLDPLNRVVKSVTAYVHVFGLFYNCPDLYDLDAALKMARTAVEQWPDFDAGRRALGAALYRSGRFEEAIPHQMKALAMYGGEATDLFLLAMEQWQLGHRAEARAHYDRAVAWMEERNPDYPEFVRLREEASELLGIQLSSQD
jgi:tetratricopeptide (TPR) repeat protein